MPSGLRGTNEPESREHLLGLFLRLGWSDQRVLGTPEGVAAWMSQGQSTVSHPVTPGSEGRGEFPQEGSQAHRGDQEPHTLPRAPIVQDPGQPSLATRVQELSVGAQEPGAEAPL